MSALDGIAAVHPVVGVAVLAFKAVATLEMKRRDNEKKVIALHLQMQEMMSALLQYASFSFVYYGCIAYFNHLRLRGIESPDDRRSDGVTLKDRLRPLMIKIAQDITECGNACDAYGKKNLLGA